MNKKKKGFSYEPYTPSQEVTQAQQQAQSQQRPAAYSSPWQNQIDGLLGQLGSRPSFSYDAGQDAMYQQVKDLYIRQGQQAMEDTMGQAAALTGGYGNSYAQTAGQQTYQGFLQQAAQQLPEYYQMALDRYNAEGDALFRLLGAYNTQEQQAYNQYRDGVSDFQSDREYLWNLAQALAAADYQQYQDGYEAAYEQYRDEVEDSQWQAEFDEDKRRYDAENAPSPSAGTYQQPALSQAGQDFLKSLPYAHAGSGEAWKNLVAQRLQNALASGALTQTDAQLIRQQLGLN